MIRLFRVFIPTSVVFLLISEIVLVFFAFLLASYVLIDVDPEVFLLYDGGLMRIALVVASVFLGLYFQEMYTNFRIRSRIALIQQILLVTGVVFLTQALLTYANRELMMPRWVMIFGCGVMLVTLPAWRILYTGAVLKALGSQRILFLGTSPVSRDIAERLNDQPELGLLPIGFVSEPNGPSGSLTGLPVLGSIADLEEIVRSSRPDQIVVGMTERRQALPVQQLLDLRFGGVRIAEAASLYETAFGRVTTQELRPSQLIFTGDLGPQPTNMRLQAIYSFLLAVMAIVVTAPIMLLTAIAVKLTSKGDALFRQKRVGFNGKIFTLYKFRSMRADAEAATGAVWATRDDPRVTWLGKHLRRLRLDELPQLFNVLRGEMSIVGPRPERPEFVQTLSELIPFYRQRHCVRPGITGWAQINYKYGETTEDSVIKLEYDLYYIKNLSLSLDCYIVLNTIKVMLFRQSGQ